MSHIPPHKRQTKGYPSLNPTPAPESVMRYVFDKRKYTRNVGYTDHTILKWSSIGLADELRFSLLLVSKHFHQSPLQRKKAYILSLWFQLIKDRTTVSCKCPMAKDHNKIQLYKIELNRVRHMVANTSIRGKSSDLRLFVYTKKIKLALSDEEKNEIKDLIGSVILDSQVPGGLRWPLDKRHSPGGRYVVNSIGYTTAKSYMNSSIRFKFRHANRYKFESSTGEEVTQEIFMKMPGIVSELRKQTMDEDLVFEMLKDNLKLIWDLSV
uniref:DUF7903 domain-containing protein n=1 Tax=Solanum lycopersicum TaxID=4081 RepID=K4BS53_SOLLC